MTSLRAGKKTELTEGVIFDDRIFEEPDNEEEILLQDAMKRLMLESDDESSTEDALEEEIEELEVENTRLVPQDNQISKEKATKQKQITDFFQSQK